MSKINPSFTNPADISLGASITSTVINNIKNTINTYIQAITPTSPIVLLTGATTLTTNNQDIHLSGTASYDITLPVIPAGNTNVCFNFLRAASNKNGATPIVIRILPGAGNTINGASSYTVWTKDSTVTLNCNTSVLGTDWKVMDKYNNTSDLIFLAYRATNQNIPNSTTASVVELNSENVDTNSDFSTSTYTYTVRATGNYVFDGGIVFNSGTASNLGAQIVTNTQAYRLGQTNSSVVEGIGSGIEVPLTFGQTVDLRVTSDGAVRDLLGGNGLVFLGGSCMSIIN